jgi:alginate O-acetyltransferase complex protein AlgI
VSFATVAYVVFLVAVAAVWNSRRNLSPWFLCGCSLLFYGYWFPPYAAILVTCAGLSYVLARQVALPDQGHRRVVLLLVVAVLLTPLLVFKYSALLSSIPIALWPSGGTAIQPSSDMLVLPLGISFYTFQAVSYVLDVHSQRLPLCRRARDYCTYLFFFPQLVAGPIVRATHFLPQLYDRRRVGRKDLLAAFHHLSRGFFLKIAIADNLAANVGWAFDGTASGMSGVDAWLGVLMFSGQIFCDFAGYSEIAIGSARLLGFKLQRNFNNPYLSVGVRDFWSRWHISLSSWFRDYLYIPMGGNRVTRLRRVANILVVFLLSGLWHGSGLQYILWGGIHGCWVLLERRLACVPLLRRVTDIPSVRPLLIALTFALVAISWVPFRAAHIGQALQYWKAMFWFGDGPCTVLSEPALVGLILFALYHLWSLPHLRRRLPSYVRSWDGVLFLTVTSLLPGQGVDFIYFQF